MEWFYARGDMQRGPVTESELEDLVKDGIVSAETRVWREGMGDWLPVSAVPELADQYLDKSDGSNSEDGGLKNFSAESPAVPVPVDAPPLPHTMVSNQPGVPMPKQPSTYMVQAIIGLVLSFFCCFYPAIPAIIALIFGGQVQGLYNAGDYEGALSSSKKAKLCCNITGALYILNIVIVVVMNIINPQAFE